MATFQRTVKVSKTEAYEVDTIDWLGSESITSLGVTESTGNATVVSSVIDGSLLQVLVTGVNVGRAVLTFEYTTATRSDCYKVNVSVIADC